MYKKYNSGPIAAYKFDKSGLRMKQHSDLMNFLADGFIQDISYTETMLCKRSFAHHSVFKRYPEIRELLHMLNQFYFGIEEPQEFALLHKYDKYFELNKESMYTDNVKLCKEHNLLVAELKKLEQELSEIDNSNRSFDVKYPNIDEISDLLSYNPELDFPKAFYLCSDLNDMEQIIVDLIEENTELHEELERLQQEITSFS